MVDDFTFNDELISAGSETDRLRRRFPRVWFALVTPELVSAFDPIDERAKLEKSRFRTWGFAAVTMATCALILAAVEPVFLLPLATAGAVPEPIVTAIAVLAASIGLLSTLIGWMGMGIAARKREWLKLRLTAERLRQWHWQYIIGHAQAITDAAIGQDADRAAYLSQRAARFEEFLNSFVSSVGARLNEQLSRDIPQSRKTWVSPEFRSTAAKYRCWTNATGEIKEAQAELFDAVRSIRFRSQEDYPTYLLGEGSFWSHPQTQERTFRAVGASIIAAIVVMHIAIVLGVVLEVTALKSPAVYVATISLALVALAARVIEEGLRPAETSARLRSYVGEVRASQDQFDNGDELEKFNALRNLEEAAAREMVDFLRSANEARYIL